MSFEEEVLHIPGYKKVIKVTDKSVGLVAIISIHNTTMGPSIGGTRIFPYSTFKDALQDVLRLSKGMTYKSAIVQAGSGGAKSVIMADPKKDKTEELLRAFGQAVERLKGEYICAEDVGCTVDDVRLIAEETKYVCGLPHKGCSGNPSPFTARGTFRGIQSVLQKMTGTDSVRGKTIAIQGLGSVGSELVRFLFWQGAHLIISDIDQEKTEQFKDQYGATVLSPDEILFADCDVLAPCALGGILNKDTIPKLRCKAIAGATNNQLWEEEDAKRLLDRGILYAPDFVINAGGLINVLHEMAASGYDARTARDKTQQIYDQLLTIYLIAEKNKISTHEAAMSLADYRLEYGIGKREEKLCFHH